VNVSKKIKQMKYTHSRNETTKGNL